MQRMFNLAKWRTITEGEMIAFATERPRQVRLEVNSPDRVRLFVQEGTNEPAFLARVEGRDTIEFSADGPFELTVTGGDCAFYTADGDDWSVAPVEDTTFTKIVERRMRNPELEYMMAMSHRNMEVRLEQQAIEMERRFERSLALRDAERAAAPAPTPDPAGTGTAPSGETSKPVKQADGAGAPDGNTPTPAPAGGTPDDT